MNGSKVSTAGRAVKGAVLCIAVSMGGCTSWGEWLRQTEHSWFEENFPVGMTEQAFERMAPDAWLVQDQGSVKKYEALVKRPCFALCRTTEGGLKSGDILHAEFEFENGLLSYSARIGDSGS